MAARVVLGRPGGSSFHLTRGAGEGSMRAMTRGNAGHDAWRRVRVNAGHDTWRAPGPQASRRLLRLGDEIAISRLLGSEQRKAGLERFAVEPEWDLGAHLFGKGWSRTRTPSTSVRVLF